MHPAGRGSAAVRRRMALALLAACLLPPGAQAQERPNIFPTRDVAVAYRVQGGGPGVPSGLNMAWHALTRSLRMDVPGMGWMVANQDTNRAFMAMEAQRVLMDLPMAEAMRQYGPGETARFTREGQDRVAGLPCTVWRYEDRGRSGRACLTPDGVLLRGNATGPDGKPASLEATEVRYGAQDPARFARPSGWMNMQVPGLPPLRVGR